MLNGRNLWLLNMYVRIYTQYIKNYQIRVFYGHKTEIGCYEKKMQFCNRKELLDIKKINFNRMIGRWRRSLRKWNKRKKIGEIRK